MSVPPPEKPRRSSTAVLVGLSAILVTLFAVSAGLVIYLASGGPSHVNEGSFLRVPLQGEITDAPVSGGLVLDPADIPPVLTDITSAIREAADDERITGLFLVLDSPSVGWAGADDLRSAIATFRAADKPCVAYAETYTTSSYYLASACDRVVLAPTGIGLVTGLAVQQTYYAGTFEKWGVQAEMLHVGDFKSAIEPYMRREPSEPAALAMNEMLDGLWGLWIAGVAEGRGKSADEVQGWVDHPSMSPAKMLEAGMVDALAFPDQVRAHVSEARDDGWAAALQTEVEATDEEIRDRFTDLDDYLEQIGDSPVFSSSSGKIAVVYTEGPILSGDGDGGLFGGESVIGDRAVREWLAEIREDESIEALVLRVNSPGGSGLASDMIWRELMRFKATGKPVVVSMGNYAASGGYYIATAGDWIVAEPGTLTGSIGVFGGKLTFGGTYDWLGLTTATFKRGENADLLSTLTPFSEEGRATYQAFLDDFYEVFLKRVADARKMDRDAVHAVAQGRVWTGAQAKERGLVDELGGLDTALAKAASLASLEGDYTTERWPKQKTFVDLLMEDLESATAPSVVVQLPLADEPLSPDLAVLARVLADGAAALLPGSLRVAP